MHVVVTGASSGIGREIAKAFDRNANSISLVARRKTLLEELQREIAVPTAAVDADLASDAIGWLKRAEERFGPVDVLVNNAGISYVEPILGIDADRVQAMFQINTHTPIAAIQHVLPGMIERRSGVLVNVASVAAYTVAPYFCHYHATKAALAYFSECLRVELAHTGVHVVSVYPGPIDTPMADRNFNQFKDASIRRVPTGDTKTLAKLVFTAVEKRRPRVIYPAFYRLAWWLPGLARFVAARVIPEVTGQITPLMPGDRIQPPDLPETPAER